MTRTKTFLAAGMIGTSMLAFPLAAFAQEVDVDAGLGGSPSADAGATTSDGVDADADISVGDAADTDADVSLGGDSTTASINAGAGDDTDAAVDLGTDDASVDADLGLLEGLLGGGADAGTSGSGGNGDLGGIVASMSSSDIQRYQAPCMEAVSDSSFSDELRELCALILQQ